MLHRLRDYDFILIITPLLLAAFGVVMIYSASMVTAVVEGHESTYYLFRQLQWFSLGLVGFIFCSIFPYKYYHKLMKPIVLVIIGLLLAVLLFGDVRNNARSWLSLGFINLQPAEFAKLGLIMYLASVYSKKQEYINDFSKGVLPPLILTCIILGFIVMQPDIGTASIIFIIVSTIIFSSGIRYKHLMLLTVVGVGIILLALPYMVTDERITRFTGAYQPFETPDTDGYHLIQSYLAIGVGGLTGEGLGQSVQKLGYLMEAHTDFIMAIVAEELGFIGVLIVIGMLALIVLRGIFISRKCRDSFGALLALGVSSMVGIQAFINLGSISGILPITGVTLPFISYGGSSLLVLMISMGILNNIAKKVKQQEQQDVNHNQAHDHSTGKRNSSHFTGGGRKWQNQTR
ncbi:putative lipid II flippase FtsW [Oceanobacillus sp. M65]|uniref:Probable peptidoglycan glycosyltransferase FtsW n=1 Tax=Oceanobacillus jordanicus TaxID=2867266 RepID=A0AAW5B8Z5_9BACI|nr:putative lipid II flippase FtsW [Oceanobacillus jordanicus]AVQ98922.1 putative lipid II flippase FtsW [Oceanobacillus iheyensis]MCG3420455.1 putative lipid II flippase FtsW [Oceanobacillus jordanicus]